MKVDHVEPVQSLTPDRRAGMRNLLAAAIPVALLVAVVAGGFLGRTGEPAEAAAARPAPSGTTTADGAPPPTSAPVVDMADAGFPSDAFGMPVRSVEETVRLIEGGLLRESVVAVAGWLTIRPVSDDCRNEYDRGTGPTALCPRETILVASPEPVLGMDGRNDVTRLRPAGPHLHPVALPGVSLRQIAGRQYSGLATSLVPVPVVIVARVGDPRLPECRPSGRHCGEGLALERLIWADGEWQDRRALLTTPPFEGTDPSPQARRQRIDLAVRGAGTVLSEILVPRDALGGVDATADAAVEDAVDGSVWYVRFLVRVAGPGGNYSRDVGWAVIDDRSGSVVAADPARPPTPG
jgi:hypothetical protein